MHPGEDFNDGSLLEASIKSYVDNQIYEHFKLSLIDYLNNPIDVNAMLVKIASEHNSRKGKALDQALNDIKKGSLN